MPTIGFTSKCLMPCRTRTRRTVPWSVIAMAACRVPAASKEFRDPRRNQRRCSVRAGGRTNPHPFPTSAFANLLDIAGAGEDQRVDPA